MSETTDLTRLRYHTLPDGVEWLAIEGELAAEITSGPLTGSKAWDLPAEVLALLEPCSHERCHVCDDKYCEQPCPDCVKGRRKFDVETPCESCDGLGTVDVEPCDIYPDGWPGDEDCDDCLPHGIPRPDIETLNRDDWNERLNPARCFAPVAFLAAVFWAWLVRRVWS